MKQKIFRTKILEKIERDILVNKHYYINMKSQPRWLLEMLNDAENDNYSISSKIEVEPFELNIGDSKTDAQNAKTVYKHLKSLTPVQATSNELWTYMTHIQFPEYMAERWEIKENDNDRKIRNVIEERYFADRGRAKGVLRNGIARLWWAGYWGYDESRKDPYELVDVIFQYQETYEHISERSFNRNKNIMIAALEEIKSNKLTSIQVRKLFSEINSYGSDMHLDALSYNEAREMVKNIIIEIQK